MKIVIRLLIMVGLLVAWYYVGWYKGLIFAGKPIGPPVPCGPSSVCITIQPNPIGLVFTFVSFIAALVLPWTVARPRAPRRVFVAMPPLKDEETWPPPPTSE